MRWIMLSLLLIAASYPVALAVSPSADYEKLQLSDKFYSEGAYYADFNRDGKIDVIAGPYWYAGPDFQQRHEVRQPKEFDLKSYSDNFLTYTGDFNGDGWHDILYVPWPGEDASWYENPAG
ncbi:MAG: FG-GAP repeat domain-containing protein, partial [Aeoliella sp.]